MGLYSSFYASLSGLNANSQSLAVIGNDLANLNTIGFKSSSTTFQDLFNTAMAGVGVQGNGNPMQVGLGTSMSSIMQNFSQGSFQSSGNVTDMAISGQGFFMLQSPAGARSYTRAGNFTIDQTGNLVDPNGNSVLGWNRVGNALSTNGPTVPVMLNMGTTSPPVSTANFSTTTNLDANAPVGATSLYVVPVQVYDSLGQAHSIQISYTKTAANTWSYALSTDDAGATVTGGTGTLNFNAAGQLVTPPTTVSPTITGWTDGAAAMTPTWDLTSAGTPLLTQYAASSATSNTIQNGYAAGSIRSLAVDQNGVVTGNFTNGQTVQLAQVALSTFANLNGLAKIGDNSWSETLTSGPPNVGPADQGGRGTVRGSQLELSNVDVADEFTKLIINQRGYQANSRIVTTSDQLLQETLNLKQ
jgi:flagellar hook protein FlgE